MPTYLWLIPVGFLAGAYGTLAGLGGGFIIIPILLMLYPDYDTNVITSISLAVVLVNALTGTWSYARMQRIHYRTGLLFVGGTIPGAILGALTTTFIARSLFELLFGLMLIGLGILLIVNPRSKRSGALPTSPASEISLRAHHPLSLLLLNVGAGFLSSFFGIGGGLFNVPMMLFILHMPVHIATATSQFVLLFASLTGTLVHMFSGTLAHGIRQVAALSIGVIVGARTGAYLSSRMHGTWIVRSLALVLIILGLRFAFKTLLP